MHFSCDILADVVETLTFPTDCPPYCTTGDDGLLKCQLCNEEGFALGDSVKSHYAGKRHKEKKRLLVQDLNQLLVAAQLSCRLRTKPLCDDMAMLNEVGHAPWKDAVLAELCRSMLAPKARYAAEPDLLEVPLKRLRTCLANERLSLLALAVWKGKCWRQMSAAVDLDAALEWMRSGWKACKVAQYDSNAMDIVVRAVQPFLG
jgi:hypothetical protein